MLATLKLEGLGRSALRTPGLRRCSRWPARPWLAYGGRKRSPLASSLVGRVGVAIGRVSATWERLTERRGHAASEENGNAFILSIGLGLAGNPIE